jgi:hypothetical protein
VNARLRFFYSHARSYLLTGSSHNRTATISLVYPDWLPKNDFPIFNSAGTGADFVGIARFF